MVVWNSNHRPTRAFKFVCLSVRLFVGLPKKKKLFVFLSLKSLILALLSLCISLSVSLFFMLYFYLYSLSLPPPLSFSFSLACSSSRSRWIVHKSHLHIVVKEPQLKIPDYCRCNCGGAKKNASAQNCLKVLVIAAVFGGRRGVIRSRAPARPLEKTTPATVQQARFKINLGLKFVLC